MGAAIQDKRQKLQAAYDYAGDRARVGDSAEAIMAGLVEHHGASLRPRWDVSRLSCGGVTSTCTSGAGAALLSNWRKAAGLRLMMAAFPPEQV